MNIKNQLLIEHSKKNATFISDYIGRDEVKFKILMKLFLANEDIISQRAAYSLSISTDNHPELIKPHIGTLINNLDENVHDAVKRCTVRILQHTKIPNKHEGKLTEQCFDFLTSNKEPIAIKVFSMTILANMAEKYPDLKNELNIIINDLMEYGNPGIISRGKKVLKQIAKL